MLCRKLKDKNQTGQQQKQAFTDQGKIDVLKYKKANISTKKLVEFLTEKFMDCLQSSLWRAKNDICGFINYTHLLFCSTRSLTIRPFL